MNIFGTRRSFGFGKTSSRQNNRRRRFGFEPLEGRAMLAVTSGDFNGDGRDDMAVGVFAEDLPDGANPNGKTTAGAVNVIYGTQQGLSSANNQFWHQDVSGINGVAESNDNFGAALAVGDFNGDGFDDLGIGVQGEKVGGVSVGGVNVIYGSATGLRATGDQLWHQNVPGINDVAEVGDQFGAALCTGDFDGDGFDDLAIGVVRETVGGVNQAGAVNVIYGSSTGLTASGDQFWHQDVSGINGVAGAIDRFGEALAAGDFNNDGRDDLAIGTEADAITGVQAAGSVNVIYGSSSGLTASGDQQFHQDTSGINDSPETGDFFGAELATGDVNGDGFDDLAISARAEAATIGVENINGMVHLLFGSGSKLSGTGSVSLTRLDFGEPSSIGVIGVAITLADFDHDGFADLAVGAHGSLVGGVNAGAVLVRYGNAGGFSAVVQNWNQNTGTILETAESGDGFGNVLGAGDFDGDGRSDLVVAAPFETLTANQAGVVHVIYGFLEGLTFLGNQFWGQGFFGILGDQEAGDLFGR